MNIVGNIFNYIDLNHSLKKDFRSMIELEIYFTLYECRSKEQRLEEYKKWLLDRLNSHLYFDPEEFLNFIAEYEPEFLEISKIMVTYA